MSHCVQIHSNLSSFLMAFYSEICVNELLIIVHYWFFSLPKVCMIKRSLPHKKRIPSLSTWARNVDYRTESYKNFDWNSGSHDRLWWGLPNLRRAKNTTFLGGSDFEFGSGESWISLFFNGRYDSWLHEIRKRWEIWGLIIATSRHEFKSR